MGDWSVACSDDEQVDVGLYEPVDPLVIIFLYEALKRKEILQFETTVYARDKPNLTEDICTEKKAVEMIKAPMKECTELTEFDFDTQPEDNVKK